MYGKNWGQSPYAWPQEKPARELGQTAFSVGRWRGSWGGRGRGWYGWGWPYAYSYPVQTQPACAWSEKRKAWVCPVWDPYKGWVLPE